MALGGVAEEMGTESVTAEPCAMPGAGTIETVEGWLTTEPETGVRV